MENLESGPLGENTENTDTNLKSAKINRRTVKAALTRAGKTLTHLMTEERPQEEVRESLLNYKQGYENLVSKHEQYTALIENEAEFNTQEAWLEECQENFMTLETRAKLYLERKNVDVQLNNVEAGTSALSPETPVNDEVSMQNSDGIPNMHETSSPSGGITNTSPATQAPDPVNDDVLVAHANEQNTTQTCGFKMEKPKMPKFNGDVREYAIFRADFKYVIETRYSKRDAVTFLRTCLEGSPLI